MKPPLTNPQRPLPRWRQAPVPASPCHPSSPQSCAGRAVSSAAARDRVGAAVEMVDHAASRISLIFYRSPRVA